MVNIKKPYPVEEKKYFLLQEKHKANGPTPCLLHNLSS